MMREEAHQDGREDPELTGYRVDAHTRTRLAVLARMLRCLDEIFAAFNRVAYPGFRQG
jgi:hypothetical protein